MWGLHLIGQEASVKICTTLLLERSVSQEEIPLVSRLWGERLTARALGPGEGTAVGEPVQPADSGFIPSLVQVLPWPGVLSPDPLWAGLPAPPGWAPPGHWICGFNFLMCMSSQFSRLPSFRGTVYAPLLNCPGANRRPLASWRSPTATASLCMFCDVLLTPSQLSSLPSSLSSSVHT